MPDPQTNEPNAAAEWVERSIMVLNDARRRFLEAEQLELSFETQEEDDDG